MPDLRAGLPAPARGDEVGLPGGLRAPWRIEKSFRMSKTTCRPDRLTFTNANRSNPSSRPQVTSRASSKPLSRASKQTTCTRRATPAKMGSVVTSRHEYRCVTWSLALLARLLSFLNGAYRLRGLGINVLDARDTALRPERLDASIRAR
jgi:hypothetical protein